MPDGGPCRKDRGPVVADQGTNDVGSAKLLAGIKFG